MRRCRRGRHTPRSVGARFRLVCCGGLGSAPSGPAEPRCAFEPRRRCASVPQPVLAGGRYIRMWMWLALSTCAQATLSTWICHRALFIRWPHFSERPRFALCAARKPGADVLGAPTWMAWTRSSQCARRRRGRFGRDARPPASGLSASAVFPLSLPPFPPAPSPLTLQHCPLLSLSIFAATGDADAAPRNRGRS
jgi:hypothetical protein